jgi:ATP-dependent RNA helicase DeaD
VVVQSLVEEFDVVDVAAAAVKLAHAAVSGPEDRPEIDVPAERPRSSPGRPRGGADVVRLFIGAGREAGIRPGDLVGAITNEAGVRSADLGAIEIRDRFSLVEVPAEAADQIVRALKKSTIRGEKPTVRRDRDDG